MMRYAALLILLGLAACASAPDVAPDANCVDYTILEQQALAAEITSDGPEAQRWLEDYLALRKSVCKSSI